MNWDRKFIPAFGKISAYGKEKHLRVKRLQPNGKVYDRPATERHPVSTSRHYGGSFRHIRAQYAPLRLLGVCDASG